TRVVQTPDGGAANKRVELAYNKRDQFTQIIRRDSDSPTGTVAAQSDYTYEADSTRLQVLRHTSGAQTRAYTYAYDAADRITQLQSYDGTNNYGYNRRDELTSASLLTESYDYDGAGNRTNHTLDPNNELKSDGTYTYTYDKEGN